MTLNSHPFNVRQDAQEIEANRRGRLSPRQFALLLLRTTINILFMLPFLAGMLYILLFYIPGTDPIFEELIGIGFLGFIALIGPGIMLIQKLLDLLFRRVVQQSGHFTLSKPPGSLYIGAGKRFQVTYWQSKRLEQIAGRSITIYALRFSRRVIAVRINTAS